MSAPSGEDDVRGLSMTTASDLFRRVFEASYEAIAITTVEEGRFIEINDAFCALTGYDRSELIGHTVQDLDFWVDPAARDKLVGALREFGVARDVRNRFRGKGGDMPPAEFTVQLIELDGRPCILTTARDISDRVRATARAEAMAEISGALAEAASDYQRVVELIVRKTSELLGGTCGLMLLVEGGPELELVAAYDPDPERTEVIVRFAREFSSRADHGLVAEVFRTGEAVLASELPLDLIPEERRSVLETLEVGSILIVPVRYGGDVIGLLGVTRGKEAPGFGDEERDVVVDLAERAAHAISTARLLEQLRRTDTERRSLLGRLVAAQEEERARIATDLHDDPVQAMVAVDFRLETLKKELTDPGQVRALRRLQDTVELAVGRLRRLMFELRPPVLDDEGLGRAIEEYLAEVDSDPVLDWRVVDRLNGELPADLRGVAYRIALEALSNVRRHSGASQVAVTLESRDGGVLVSIRDDGSGFREEESARPGHLGLPAMRERAEMAGGWWRVHTAPGAGTLVEFFVPGARPDTMSE